MTFSRRILSFFIYRFYILWCSSLRFTESGREAVDVLSAAETPMMFCLWHDEVFPLVYVRRTLRVGTVVSRSKDGEYLDILFKALGLKTARGSSSRGGLAALLRLARLMREEKYNGCITVDGPAVISPKNVIVPLGTAISEVLDFCRVPPKRIRKLVVGGPMMGVAIPDADMPIIKYNNGILAFREVDVTAARTTACIRCGRCMRACPMNLMPLQFESAFLLKKPEELGRLKVNMCIECGSCAYSCPAARPLVQEIRLGKTMLRNFQAKNEGSGVKK